MNFEKGKGLFSIVFSPFHGVISADTFNVCECKHNTELVTGCSFLAEHLMNDNRGEICI